VDADNSDLDVTLHKEKVSIDESTMNNEQLLAPSNCESKNSIQIGSAENLFNLQPNKEESDPFQIKNKRATDEFSPLDFLETSADKKLGRNNNNLDDSVDQFNLNANMFKSQDNF